MKPEAEILLRVLGEETTKLGMQTSVYRAVMDDESWKRADGYVAGADRMLDSFNDLSAVIYLLQERGLFPSDGTGAGRIEAKIAAVKAELAKEGGP
jgi:hypothetical protein